MSRRDGRVLVVTPVSRGFGVFVMDASGRALEWRVKEIDERPSERNARCVFEVDKLIEAYRPSVLVLEDHRAPGAKKHKRIRLLLDALTELAIDSGVGVAVYGPRTVRAAIALAPSANKDDIAAAVAKRLPILRGRIPKPRRIWDSERHAMSMFMAAALALTHHGRAQRKDGP